MFKKLLITAGFIGTIILILAVGVIITKTTVHDYVSIDSQLKENITQLAHNHYDNPLERILIMFGESRIVSVNPPNKAEVQFFTFFHVPLSILRGQPNATLEIDLGLKPLSGEVNKVNKAKESVKKFMNDPGMDLVYSYYSYHPSNYMIGKRISKNKEIGGMKSSIDMLHPVYVFQEKKFINNDCQVYQYEVSTETLQVVEIQTAWPRWFQAEEDSKCPDAYSLSAKNKEVVEKFALDILAKDPEHTDIILANSNFQAKFTELKYSYDWLWEDESISLPEELTGDPFQHPVMRIMMTKDGRLDYYLNTFDIFEK